MLNIIIILLLISSLINFILNRGKISPILQCGIWAYFGNGSRHFNKDKFNILGILNDSRGGDGAGFLAGKNVRHMSDKKYIELIQEWVVPSPRHSCVLGHTRKASSGGKNIEYTQPFCYTDDDKILGGLIHNGTLYNEDFLQEKYNVPKTFIYNGEEYEPNDTQVLAYILLHYKNFDVLKDYRGAAALIWEDRTTGFGYIYKGASKKFNYANSVIESERPLFMYTCEKDKGIWLSSLEDPLWAIAEEVQPDIEEVKDNTIVVIDKGKIVDEIFINRTDSTQARVYNSTTNHNPSDYTNLTSAEAYNFYDEYYAQKQKKRKNHNKNQKSKKEIQLAIPEMSAVIKSQIGLPVYQFAKELNRLTAFNDQIQWAAGRYYTAGNEGANNTLRLAHGVFHFDEAGWPTTKDDTDSKPYYFIEGVMIFDHNTYQKVIKLYKQLLKGKYMPKNCTNKTNEEVKKIALLSQFSIYPITNIKSDDLITCWAYNDNTTPFTGEFSPLFNNKRYKFTDGKIVEISIDDWRYPDHASDKSKQTVEKDVDDSPVEIIMVENEFYANRDNPETIIQYNDLDENYGTTKDGMAIFVDSPEDWEQVSYLEWLHAGDETTSEITEDEKKWYDDEYTEGACKKFDEVVRLLNDIESEAMMESSVKSSKTVYSLVEKLKNEIRYSELNIN